MTFIIDFGNKGIYATLDKNGIADFMIEAGKDSPVRGKEMFRRMVEYYGDNLKAVAGNWTYGDNLAAVNKLTESGVPLEKAVIETWTGYQASKYGFAKAVIETVEGTAGKYIKLRVLFTK
ncbi:MAG: hypothetical protein GY795_51455 [Desulfobacterales bacterium]|nr:hypothetical protein [Desulfobacterales bacterium]